MTTTDEDIEDLLNSDVMLFAKSQEMDRCADYLRRSRQLADVGTNELKARCIQSYRDWRSVITDPAAMRGRSDIEAELALRGEEAPLVEVAKEIGEQSRFVADRLDRDPATRRREAEEMLKFFKLRHQARKSGN